MTGDNNGTTIGLTVIGAVGCIAGLLALLAIPEVPRWGVAVGVVVVMLAFGWEARGVVRRDPPSTPMFRDISIADGLRSIEARLARLGNAPSRKQRHSPTAPNSRSIAAAVFGDRVRNEEISQTGPGDTHVVLLISGSPIPGTHVDELLRMYQARYDRGFVDLTITSDDDSVSVRTDH